MTTIKAFIERHPLLSFYALTFAISWGGILLAVGLGPGGFSATPEQLQKALPYVVPAMFLGPSVACILLTGLLSGRAGFRDLLARMTRWRVGARWYAVALLTAPLVFTAVLLALSLTSSEFLPRIFTAGDKASLVLMGLAVGVDAIFEELGWTGFATPRMRLRYGVLATGLFVGVLWQAWHLFQGYWASGVTTGEVSMTLWVAGTVVAILVGQLVAFRVLMVWVYERTNGSLLVAILMHASLIASSIILFPPLAVVASLISGYATAAVLWIIVAVIVLANHGHLTRQQPLRGRVA